nr:MAG TPA: ParD-like antitoxin of type II bacterial toxin-antitoxin system [Caudoviricetes sp.]
MPRELHHKILNTSKKQNRTISGQCVFFLKQVLTPLKEES